MKLTAIALTCAFAVSSTCAFAHIDRQKFKAKHSHAAPSAILHPKDSNPNGNFSGYGSRDVWGHWGAYYGPMIPTGAGGR
jgi:hypothetical protein